MTQLAFRFQSVEKSAAFPLGVKTMYKAYSKDKVYDIVPVQDSAQFKTKSGWIGAGVYNFWGPIADEAYGTDMDGMYILKHLPSSGRVLLSPFKDKFLDELNLTIIKVSSTFQERKYLEDWREF